MHVRFEQIGSNKMRQPDIRQLILCDKSKVIVEHVS